MAEEATTPAEEVKEEPKKVVEPERTDITTLHERTIAALSYFSFLAIIPFYLKKDSEFCRFHGKQGMLLAIFFVLAQLFAVIDFIDDLFKLIQVFFMFYMGFAALSGRWKKMPIGYNYSCQLEDALTLKSKEQEDSEVGLKPNALDDEAKASIRPN